MTDEILSISYPLTIPNNNNQHFTIGPSKQGERWSIYNVWKICEVPTSIEVYKGSIVRNGNPSGGYLFKSAVADLTQLCPVSIELQAGEMLSFNVVTSVPPTQAVIIVNGVINRAARQVTPVRDVPLNG